MTNQWHHSPVHLFTPGGVYIVTGGTLYKEHFFHGADRLEYLHNTLLEILDKRDWDVHAWAVFVNHYHFIAEAPKNEDALSLLIQEFHAETAKEVNRLDGTLGRQVWFQYWGTCLTYEKSWLARLHYVHNNAVHHGLVKLAENYPYCSASWFKQNASPVFVKKVQSFKYNTIKIVDNF